MKLAWVFLMGISLLAPQAEAASVAVGPFSGDRDPRAWLPGRAAALLTQYLGRLGLQVRGPRFARGPLAAERTDAFIEGRVAPGFVRAETDPIELSIALHTPKGERKLRKRGPAHQLDRMVLDLAVEVADGLGHQRATAARALLLDLIEPYAVHKALGKAEIRLRSGALRQAVVTFDRAAELHPSALIDALAGRRWASAKLSSAGASRFGSRAELARSSWERVQVARRDKANAVVLSGLRAFLRYTDRPARLWSIERNMTERAQIFALEAGRWWAQGTDAWGRLRFDPRTGVVLGEAKVVPGLVASVQQQLLSLRGRTLKRTNADGRVVWKRRLPSAPRAKAAERMVLAAGYLGVPMEEGLAWVDASFGKISRIAKGVVPLTSGDRGAVVLMSGARSTPDLALLRPGKRAPSWRALVDRPKGVRITRDRVVVVSDQGLEILRVHNGKRVKVLPLEAGARFLEAHGRYALLVKPDQKIALFDVLAGEQTALLQGPGKPVSGYTYADGVAVLFESGDLVFYDRDGRMMDRALVPGSPLAMRRGSALLPGPIVQTNRGLFAFREVSADPTHVRDVDALLVLAQTLKETGDVAGALRIATALALESQGRVSQVEALRAQLYGARKDEASQRAARVAAARSKRAKDPTKALPPFSLLGAT